MKYVLLFLSFIASFALQGFAQSTDLKIVKKYITYNAQRELLSLEYLKERHGLTQQRAIIDPKFIVIHFTGSGTMSSNFNYFNNVEIENARKRNKNQSKLNVSAQFLVDRDGTVYQLMDDNQFARHTIGLNYSAIGVENIGSNTQPLTEAQAKANIALIKHLCKKYKIEYLIGHSEYGVFRNTCLWKETNPKYFTHKIDPGESFMKKLRLGVQELQLKSKP